MGNASRGENGCQVVERPPEVVAHLVDVVPLVPRGRNGDVVSVQLELVELPLEDEKRGWKKKNEFVKIYNIVKILSQNFRLL